MQRQARRELVKLAPPEVQGSQDEAGGKATPGSAAGDKGQQQRGQGTGGRAYWKVRTGYGHGRSSVAQALIWVSAAEWDRAVFADQGLHTRPPQRVKMSL